jgi:hypothetical protein
VNYESTALVIARDLHRLMPWCDAIRKACAEKGESPYLLAAICLRESGASWGSGYDPKGSATGSGDGGHGRGLFQIDDRYHRPFVESEKFADPLEQARYALGIVRAAREWFKDASSGIAPDDLERAAVAAYNAGPGAVFHRLQSGENPDQSTTGGDYSRWIMDKVAALQLADPHLFDDVRELA